jgi:hypothetical protein
MGAAAGSVSHMLRREWTFRSIEDEILIVRGADLRPGEEAEGPHLALLNIDRWLSEPFQASILAEMCYSSVGVGGADIGPRDQLRARLEEAFGSRSLVVVRPASRMRGATGSTPVVHQLLRDTSGGRSVSADMAGEGPKHGRRGWEVPGRTVPAMVAAKSDLMPGEPFEDAQLPISFLDRWIADVPQRKKLREMYKAVYGPGDAACHSTIILKTKLEAAFRKKELVMLRVSRGGGGGGGGTPPKPGDDKAAKGEKEAVQAPPVAKKPEKTWVRFRLLDEDGEPMDEEPYEMVDSNGTQRKGKLDKDGTIYIPPILTPGNCTITFPEIHLNPLKNPKRKRTRKIS